MHMMKLTAFGVLLMLVACSNRKEALLCKQWQVSDVVFINEKEALVQSDTMQGNLQKRTEMLLRDVMMKNIYEFKDDGSYRTGNAAASSQGEWELKGANIRFISHKNGEEKTKDFPIEKLQEDTLIVVLEDDQTSVPMKLILTPIVR
jgi:hypothetical protein